MMDAPFQQLIDEVPRLTNLAAEHAAGWWPTSPHNVLVEAQGLLIDGKQATIGQAVNELPELADDTES
jgi:hypothetical protein